MSRLNFHHLHYFWAVAKEGNLTRAAARLHVSQSVLSTQIKRLEEQLGHALFTRVGAVSTLSRNFQENFVKPLLSRSDVALVLQSGSLQELLQRLRIHTLDVVLSTRRVHADADHPWRCRSLARQPVSLVGKPRPGQAAFRFPQDLVDLPVLLPSRESDIRAGFDLLCEQHGLRCNILAEVDDMALLRLLARDAGAVALLPSVVVRDELLSGQLVEYCVVPDLIENFYAITVKRHFEPALLQELLRRDETDVLGAVGGKRPIASH